MNRISLRTLHHPLLYSVLLSGCIGLWRLWIADGLSETAFLRLLDAEIATDLGQQGGLYGRWLAQWPLLQRETLGFWTQWIMSTALAGAFMGVVMRLTHVAKVRWIAAFVIACHPFLNDLRSHFTPEFAYWCLFLIAVRGFMTAGNSVRDNLWWQSIMGISLYVHPETLLLWLLWPLFWLTAPPTGMRWGLITALSYVGLGFWAATATGQHVLGELIAGLHAVREGWHRLAGQSDHLRLVLSPSATPYAYPTMVLLLALIFIDKLVTTLSPLYCVLPWFRAFRQRLGLTQFHRRLLQWLIGVQLLICGGQLVAVGYLSALPLMSLTLLLLLLMPFLLAAVHDLWLVKRRLNGAFLLMGLLLGFMFIDGLFSLERHHHYLRQAGQWITSQAPESKAIYFNEGRLIYYSGRLSSETAAMWRQLPAWHVDEAVLRNTEWAAYDGLAVWISHRTPEIVELLHRYFGPPTVEFANRAGDRVQIFWNPSRR